MHETFYSSCIIQETQYEMLILFLIYVRQRNDCWPVPVAKHSRENVSWKH